MVYYGVRIGRVPGVYSTWKECEAQTKGFPNASFKKFKTRLGAFGFANDMQNSSNSPPNVFESTHIENSIHFPTSSTSTNLSFADSRRNSLNPNMSRDVLTDTHENLSELLSDISSNSMESMVQLVNILKNENKTRVRMSNRF